MEIRGNSGEIREIRDSHLFLEKFGTGEIQKFGTVTYFLGREKGSGVISGEVARGC